MVVHQLGSTFHCDKHCSSSGSLMNTDIRPTENLTVSSVEMCVWVYFFNSSTFLHRAMKLLINLKKKNMLTP